MWADMLANFWKPSKPAKTVAKATQRPQKPQLRVVEGTATQKQNKPKQPTLIARKEDLPTFSSILSGPGGPVESRDPKRRSLVAAIEVGVSRAALVINKDDLSNAFVFALEDALKTKGFKIVERFSAPTEVLMELHGSEEHDRARKHADIFQGESPDGVKLFEHLVGYGLEKRATDLHVEIRERVGKVRYRIDGILDDYRGFASDELLDAVSVAYMKLADNKSRSHPAFNKDLEQDCVIPLSLAGRNVRLRYQQIPAAHGVDYVIRLLVLDRDDKTKSLVELGYTEAQRRMLTNAVQITDGAIILAGVTGSGKSTTLKTMMSMVPDYLKRFSIEDPVEYKMPGVTQISVQRSARESGGINPFVAAMRVLMRGDPDVIMVGEIRDTESGSIAKTMIQTGHEVLTTVHASSAPGIIPRMASEEIGLSREVLGSPGFLTALCYQKLLPKLCPHCRKPAEKNLSVELCDLISHKFDLDISTMYVANEGGCSECGSKHGVRGQTIAAEIIIPNSTICELIVSGKDAEMLRYWRGTRRTGFADPDSQGKTAFEHGLYLVSHGLVDPMMLEKAFKPFETYEVFEMGAY